MATRSFSEMSVPELAQAGRFTHLQNSLAWYHEEYFPIEGDVTDIERLVVLRFNARLSTDEILAEFEKREIAGGKLRGLLTYRAHNLNRGPLPLAAIGSLMESDDRLYVPAYSPGNCMCGGIHLDICYQLNKNHIWQPTTYFLGIRPE